MIEIFNGAVYNISSSADIRLKVWYEHRRSGNKMDYRFKWRMYLSYANSETPNPYAWYSNNRRVTFVLNNSQVYENNSQSSSGGWDTGEITTSWYSVNNKTSGTTPFYFRALDTQNTGWMNYTSGTYQLAVDPAGSVIGSINNFELEDDITIPMTVYNSEFSNEITVKLGNTTIGTRSETITSSGDYTLTFSQNELNAIYQLYTDSNLQKEFTFELKTYDNGTQIGETSTTTAIGILTNCSPVLDAPVSTSITSPVQIPADTVIKNVSYIMFGVSAHSKKYARITSARVNNNYLSKVSESTTGGEHYVIYNGSILANTNIYNCIVTDNRSQTVSVQKTFSVIDYVPLTINAKFERLNSTSNSIKLTYSGNFWAGNFGNGTSGYQDNAITLNWYYKLSTDTNWTSGGSLTPTISSQNNTYSGSLTLSGTYNYDKDYDFKIEYSDLVTTTKEFKQTVIKGLGILELYKTTALINGNLDVTGHNTILEVSPTEPTNKAKSWIQYSQNIFDGVLELGQYNMANGTKQSSTSLYRCAKKIPVLPNTKYTISVDGTAHQYLMFYYKQDGSFINYGDNRTGTFTTPSNCYYITFRCYAVDYVSNYSSLRIQIEKGENATPYTEYEPDTSINVYNGNEYVPISTGCNYSNKFFGQVIWTNPNPSSSFANQTITVDDMSNFKYIEIYFKKSGNETPTNSWKILKGFDTELSYIDSSFILFMRTVTYKNNTQLEFGQAKYFGGASNFPVTNDNNRCIPIYIVGHKEL